jgi:hypothetical protein
MALDRQILGKRVVGLRRRKWLAVGAATPVALAGCAAPAAPAGAIATGVGMAALPAAPAVPVAGTLGAAAGAGLADQLVRVTIEVKKKALVDGLLDYLNDPASERSRRHPVVEDFSSPKRLGLPKQLLEALVLEGDLTREVVDDFVTGLLDGYENMVIVE